MHDFGDNQTERRESPVSLRYDIDSEQAKLNVGFVIENFSKTSYIWWLKPFRYRMHSRMSNMSCTHRKKDCQKEIDCGPG